MTSPSLNGKRVLVPRGEKNAKSFSTIVENYGGIPIEVPLLGFRPVLKREHLKPLFENLHTYDWIIFTSDVTVETFFSILGEHTTSLPKIAAIGEKTKTTLTQRNVSVDFVPKEYVAEGFSVEFSSVIQKDEKILIPKGNLARDYIAQYFEKKGHVVDEVVMYETFFPEKSKEKLIELLKTKSVDVLPFTSPSTIDHFMGVVQECNFYEQVKDCIIAAIGPVSKKRCEALGMKVDVMPKIYTSEEMLKAVAEYMKTQRE